mgnify:CR=1 FL=1
MGYLDNSVEYGFGQLGSAYLADTTAFTPPSGLVVVAITIIDDIKFAALTPDTSGYTDGTTGAEGMAYFGTTTPVGRNGTNADAVPTSDVFPRGITIYGRWTTVDLSQGAVILYFGI